jgi:lipopolysaccharide biosynthesis regulator YciM
MTLVYRQHKYQPPEDRCQECGGEALDHFWKCEKHEVMGNGEPNCPQC